MSLVEAYIQANSHYEATKLEVAAMASLISEVGKFLAHAPDRVHFTNTSGAGIPIDVAMRQDGKGFDANRWPSPDQINAVITKRFAARRSVDSAWSKIPADQRSSLVGPKY